MSDSCTPINLQQEAVYAQAINPITTLQKELSTCDLSTNIFGGRVIHTIVVPGAEGIIPQFPPAPVTPGTQTWLLGRMLNLLAINDTNASSAFVHTGIVSKAKQPIESQPIEYADLANGEELIVKFTYPMDLFGNQDGLIDSAGNVIIAIKSNTTGQNINVDLISPNWAERVYSGAGFIVQSETPTILSGNVANFNVESELDINDNVVDTYLNIPLDITYQLRNPIDPRISLRIYVSGIPSSGTSELKAFTRFTSTTVSGSVLIPSVNLSTPKLSRRTFAMEDYWRAFVRDNIIKVRGRDDDTSLYVYTGGVLTRVPISDINLSDSTYRLACDEVIGIDEKNPNSSVPDALVMPLSLTDDGSEASVIHFRFESPFFSDPIKAEMRLHVQNVSDVDAEVRVFRIESLKGNNVSIKNTVWNNYSSMAVSLLGTGTVTKNSGAFITTDFTEYFLDRGSDVYFLVDTSTLDAKLQVSTRSNFAQVDGLFTMPFVLITWHA